MPYLVPGLGRCLVRRRCEAIAGFTDYVTSEFAAEQGRSWFQNMLDQTQVTGAAALFPVADPANAGARLPWR